MKQFNRQAAFVAAFSLSVSSLLAGPTVVSPRVAPNSSARAASAAAKSSHGHPPKPQVKTVTSTVDGARGSLRAVLADAPEGATIKFSLRCPAVISLTNTLVITQDVNIVGPGADQLTVMRSSKTNTPWFRVFDVESGDVSISGLTISNGIAFDATSFVDNVGGGIFNHGNLTVSDCVISGNSAPSSGTNSTGFGGGIFSDVGSELTLIDTTISGNQATAAGGGISTIDAILVAKGCTFSDNFAIIQGGGVNFQGLNGLIQNCTISGNSTPPGGAGSGLLTVAFDAQAAPSLNVTACTIADNTGATNGAVCLIALNGANGLTNIFLSTIVANNDSPNFYFYGPLTFTSLGHNLDSDGTSGLSNGVNGDLVGTSGSPIDPLLGPLQDNGGPTYTMALLIGSPALNTGYCGDAQGVPLKVDQRGFPRSDSTGCDIGAYENEPLLLVCPSPITTDANRTNGAVVYYRSKVIDLCPSTDVTYTPPSGSVLPFGTTLVSVVATDDCSGNSNACSFTVTVLTPQGVKSNVVDKLEALAWNASPWDQDEIQAAIDDINASLGIGTPNVLWLDATHLSPVNGGQVFAFEQDAVQELEKLGHTKWSHFHGNVADDQIDRLVQVDRLLATVSLSDAISHGGTPSKIMQAKKEISIGDVLALHGKASQAIQHYWKAWSLTSNL